MTQKENNEFQLPFMANYSAEKEGELMQQHFQSLSQEPSFQSHRILN
jgi:hypothetical protein